MLIWVKKFIINNIDKNFPFKSMKYPLFSQNQDNHEDLFIKNNKNIRKRKWLLKTLDSLNLSERKIINSRYICETPSTLEVIDNQLNISKERVR